LRRVVIIFQESRNLEVKTEDSDVLKLEIPLKTEKLPLAQIIFCFALFMLVGMASGATGVQLPDLRNFYGLDNSVVGLLYLGATVGYALAAFCSGFLVEKLGLRLFLLTGVTIFALSSLLAGLAPVFLLLLFSRMAVSFGAAIMESGPNLFIASLPRSTTLLNYLHAFFGAGALVGPLVATFLLTSGWRWNSVWFVWLVAALPALVACSLLFPRRVARPELTNKQTEKSGGLMKTTLSLPVVWLGAIFLVIYVGLEITIGAWAYTFMVEARFYDAVFSGWAVSGYWGGLTLGRIILAPLAERLHITNRGLVEIGLGLTGIGILIIWQANNEAVTAAGLVLFGLGLGPLYPTTLAILAKLVPERLLPTTIGFVSSLSIVGVAIFPAIAGLVIDNFGFGWFMPYSLLLGILMVGSWLVFRWGAK
jgi:fucose permease